ncbi:MAG: hypothetical protein KGH49_03080 [Candidatus Micrarchaeota archaeon]|nr:hypothetical protein [Candidatus Micrarchaeota archaeon]
MPTRLSPEICYIAGLAGKTKQGERSMVGINTTIDEMIENFVEVAMKLGVEPKKIIIEDTRGIRHAYFFHSKIAKQIRDILAKETKVFRHKNEFAAMFLAGMFDANGKIRNGSISIGGMSPADRLVIENLGMRTKDSKILDAKKFAEFVGERSVILGGMF